MTIYLLMALLLYCLVLCSIREQRAIEARVGFSPQPCISDDDFCAGIPDVPPELALQVRDVLVDATGWDRDEIHPSTRLVEFELW